MSVALTLIAGFWLRVLVQFRAQLPMLSSSSLHQWLNRSVVALPAMAIAVALANGQARRLLKRSGRESRAQAVMAGGSIAALSGSAALAFTAGGPIALHFIQAMPVALVAATGSAAFALRDRSPWAAPIALRDRRVRVTASALAGVLVSSLAAVPAVTAAGSKASTVGVASAPGDPCDPARLAAVPTSHKEFWIDAIALEIPLNNWGDYDPQGLMYVVGNKLDAKEGDADYANSLPGQLAAVRAQEKAGKDWKPTDPMSQHVVTPGLKSDAIQPLSMRVNEGDCLDIHFRNEVPQVRATDKNDYGFHVNGIAFASGSSGDAVGRNDASDSRGLSAGQFRDLRFFVPIDETMEGAHYISPGPGFRDAISHGLFGTMTVEPPGSIYLDPNRTPAEIDADQAFPTRQVITGDEAMIIPCLTEPTAKWCQDYAKQHQDVEGQPDAYSVDDATGVMNLIRAAQPFRDNVTAFHEIGPEDFIVRNRDGSGLPFIDPTTEAYRPGARAVNYRSEPFMHRLMSQAGKLETLSYDSYTFGDPAVPVTRAYSQDPMKIRFVHAGAEVFHVYHLHSGGLHWSLNPKADHEKFDYGNTSLDKFTDDPQQSNVLDAQAAGPGESYNLELNHGAGGPQNAIGDFTYHCHIPEHYTAGMWGIRRVFNTLQPDLWELPDSLAVAHIAQQLGYLTAAGQSSAGTPAEQVMNFTFNFPYVYEPHQTQGQTRVRQDPATQSVSDFADDGSITNLMGPISNNRDLQVPQGVDSAEFLRIARQEGYQLPDGTTFDGTDADIPKLLAWIKPQLPPPTRGDANDDPTKPLPVPACDLTSPKECGVVNGRGDQDAASMDWVVSQAPDGLPLILGEREWPNDPSHQYTNLPVTRAQGAGVDGHLGSFATDAGFTSADGNTVGGFSHFGDEAAWRPAMLFNPSAAAGGAGQGRPAYPLIRSHIEQRPPFSANGHTGAPNLGETGAPVDPTTGGLILACPPGVDPTPETPCTPVPAMPNAWAGRQNAVCPYDSVHQHHVDPMDSRSPFDENRDDTKRFNIVVAEVPIRVTKSQVDEQGLVHVLAQDKDQIYRDNGKDPALAGTAQDRVVDPTKAATNPNPPTELQIRGNVGDCVNFTLVNEEHDGGVASKDFAKANLHIHHVQFDPPATDGAVIGFNYEMAIRPYKQVDHKILDTSLPAGATTLHLAPSEKKETNLLPGVFILVGEGTNHPEPAQIQSLETTSDGEQTATLVKPLQNTHLIGEDPAHPMPAVEWAGTEFVQGRWYLNEQLDNIFFHDHSNGSVTWPHGAVGQIIVEPRGSTYHDPTTGKQISSGPIADIRVHNVPFVTPTGESCTTADGDKDTTVAGCAFDKDFAPPETFDSRPDRGVRCDLDAVCADKMKLAKKLVEGSFREFGILMNGGEGTITGATVNTRAEPLASRDKTTGELLSSATSAGDPFTDLPRAYAGDPFVIRTINTTPNIDTFHVDGHRFYLENRLIDENGIEASPQDTLHGGPSERWTLILAGGAGAIKSAPGPVNGMDGITNQAGDYLYMNGTSRKFREGAWGIIRVLEKRDKTLEPLPGTKASSVSLRNSARMPIGLPADAADGPQGLCPTGEVNRVFSVSAVDLPGAVKAAYIATPADTAAADAVVADVGAKAARGTAPEPMVLHVAEGDCIRVDFTNRRTQPATFHVNELQHKLASSGITIGSNPDQNVQPNGTKSYFFYADSEKIGSAIVTDMAGAGDATAFNKVGAGAPEPSGVDGLYGAIVVSPHGAEFSNPSAPPGLQDTGTEVAVHVTNDGGETVSAYRDATLLFADTEKQLGGDFMPYPLKPSQPGMLNYGNEAGRGDGENAFSSQANKGDPHTVVSANEGDQLVFHVIGAPGSDQDHVFSAGGLNFEYDHYLRQGDRNLSETKQLRGFGPWETFDAWVLPPNPETMVSAPSAGDYFVGDARRPFTQSGLWGLIRINGGDCTTMCPAAL